MSSDFICPTDGLFKDSNNCQKYYECIWIGTPFEKQKHLACTIDLIYNPRSFRCDKASVFEKQFENGIHTADDLLEFMRFRNCMNQAFAAQPYTRQGFLRSNKLALKNQQKMRQNIETVNEFLSENINVLARARFAFQKNRYLKNVQQTLVESPKNILIGGRMITKNLNRTISNNVSVEANTNSTGTNVTESNGLLSEDSVHLDKILDILKVPETSTVNHRKFMINETERSLLEKFMHRGRLRHSDFYNLKTRYQMIEKLKGIINDGDATNSSILPANSTSIEIENVTLSSSSDNRTNSNFTQTTFKMRKLLSVLDTEEPEEVKTKLESREYDVTDLGYQNRDQAVDKFANEVLGSYQFSDTEHVDKRSQERIGVIEEQIKQHLKSRNHMRFGSRTPGDRGKSSIHKPKGMLRSYANQVSIDARLQQLAEFLKSQSDQRLVVTPTPNTVRLPYPFLNDPTSRYTSSTAKPYTPPKFDPMFTRIMTTKNSMLQTYIISQTKIPNRLSSLSLNTKKMNGERFTSSPMEDHNLIDCKDNDFGLECSCSITLSPPRCKKLINAFLSSCRILGCQNNGRCINMTQDFPSNFNSLKFFILGIFIIEVSESFEIILII